MHKAIEGIYRNGKVELLESPPSSGESRVLVTFLPGNRHVNLRQAGMDENQATDLRGRLQAFAEDWGRPEMDVYDDL